MESSPTRNLSAQEIISWLRDWVSRTTGNPVEDISVSEPLTNVGLSSRDVVILSGELENLLGVRLDATVAYEHPTISSLAGYLAGGAPQPTVRRVAAGAKTMTPESHDIAIVGMAARYPKAETLDEFWDLLVAGCDGIGDLPLGRWSEYSGDAVMAKKLEETNTTGGYLRDIASFDPEFFGLSPVEAANMDPQQRIILELSWQALEHARIPANTLKGEPVGVWIGSTNNDYGMLIAADPAEAHPYALTGTASSIIPNRVSYSFDFRGPSISVDTACSSSLVALHQAVRALRSGDASMALAGGVNILASPFISTAFGELGVISPTGKIHAFSENADGFVRADGAGIVVLKRVGDALKDGDKIYAVIKGTAVTSDGRSNGLTAPNPDAQVEVLHRAYEDAGIDPATVDYVEAHGTGTILGDPIEAGALGRVLGQGRTVTNPLLLGSAKSNFGHSEAAAGIAGVIKVVEGLTHGVIPPSVNYSGPNPYIDFDANHLEVVEDPREWPAYGGTPTAGVSGFGFGGTNAHAVISAFNPDDYDTKASERPAQIPAGDNVLLPVSGLVPSRRRRAATVLADWLEAQDDGLDMMAVERALARNNHGRSCAIVHAADKEQAITRLRYVADGEKAQSIDSADQPMALGPVFVYSGFGSQHRKMAKELYEQSPFFAQRIDELNELIVFESGWSLVDLVLDDSRTYDTETAQVAITAIQIALTDLLAECNAHPAAVIGMSMGEIAAAYAAGGLTDKDAMLIACHRSRLMGEGEKSLPEDQLGAMAVVALSAAELDELIATNPEYQGIEPAVYVGAGLTTVGGPRDKVQALVAFVEKQNKVSKMLNVKGAGHTSAVEPILGELAAEISLIEPRPLTIPLYSSVDRGVIYQPGDIVHEPEYWTRCTRGRVWFLDAVSQALIDGHGMLVEICPNPVAILGMMDTAFFVDKSNTQLLYTLKRHIAPGTTLRELLAKMWVAGQPVDLTPIVGDGPLATVPGTSFKKQRYWTAARPSSTSHPDLPGAKVSLPDGSVAFSALAETIPSTLAVIEAAAAAVNPTATVVACEEQGTLPASGEITTIAKKNVGGVSVQVFTVMGGTTNLIAEGFAASNGGGNVNVQGGLTTTAKAADPKETGLPDIKVDAVRWDPSTGETVEERLRAIVSESMGYDIEDLPGELPLIDLGLDSLMGMRIKNRVENDFQIPPLQVQALRDASVADVVTLVENLVADRDKNPDTATVDSPAPVPTKEEEDSPAPAPKAGSGVGVAPRDASERMVFATWAAITGQAAKGVTSPLPQIDAGLAKAIAERLAERSGASITVEDVTQATTLEPLSDKVREALETDVDGNIRVLRDRQPGSKKPAVFMFHPAGGSSVVYQPLMRRLPDDVPVYGVERREGTLEERAAAYIEEIKQFADGHPIILGGWSFGGALAYEVAHQLVGDNSVTIPLITLLDTVQPAEPIPDTPEETRARWQRYSLFAKKTYGLDFPIPYDMLDSMGEDAMLDMLGNFLATTDPSEHGLAAGVLEHQRASFVDNRILARLDMTRWADVKIPVLLFRAERMHDGAIELEPRYATINKDGGWAQIVDDLEIVQLHGDHLAVVDEPEIGTVGAVLTRRIDSLGF